MPSEQIEWQDKDVCVDISDWNTHTKLCVRIECFDGYWYLPEGDGMRRLRPFDEKADILVLTTDSVDRGDFWMEVAEALEKLI